MKPNNNNESKFDNIDSIDPRDLDILIAFFNKILTSPYNFGENFYNQLVKNNPELQGMFENVHRTNLGYVFLHSVVAILNVVQQQQNWRKMIHDLAYKHKNFPIKDEHFTLINQSFRRTIEQYRTSFPSRIPINLNMLLGFFDEFLQEFKNGYNKARI